MQTDHLRYFLDVAKLGSLSATAEKNFMTPQGISRTMTALEGALGCKLFIRDTNRISLSYIGSHILESVERLLEDEKVLRGEIRTLSGDLEQAKSALLTMYCNSIAFDTPLFYPMADGAGSLFSNTRFFQRPNSEIEQALLEAAKSDTDDVTLGMLALFEPFGESNAAMIERLSKAGYEYFPFMQTYDFVLVSSRSKLAKKKYLTKAEVRSQPLAVSSQGDMEKVISHVFGSDRIFVSTSDSSFRIQMCKSGDAITFVPGINLEFNVPDETTAVPMQEPYKIEIGFVASPNVFQGPVISAITNKLRLFYSSVGSVSATKLLDPSAPSAVTA